jgi:hypothetical protein
VRDPDITSLPLYDLQIKAGDVESWILKQKHVQYNPIQRIFLPTYKKIVCL